MEKLDRKIYESVPGKQVTMSHVIANPDKRVLDKLGFTDKPFSAMGIMTITPGEAAIIAVDITKKAGDVEIGFVDRFSGSVVILGDISNVRNACEAANHYLSSQLGFTVSKITTT